MNTAVLVVLFDVEHGGRRVIREVIGTVAEVLYLPDVEAAARAEVLRRATVILAQNTATELTPDEHALIHQVRLLQFYTAGVDFIPLQDLPASLPIATNGGAFAEPMAEHALALTLAAAKRLFVEHRQLATGAFNQFTPNRMLAGRVCGIFGFGGIGVATARLMRAVGMQIHAINRRGDSAEPTEWIGTPAQLNVLLHTAEVLVIAAPLTHATLGRIGARELALLPEDAILVNLARGEIIEEGALFTHLQRHPAFTACLDAWWVEPVRHGVFRMQYPFLELPNVIGSPHNAASVGGWHQVALRRAAANCRRALTGEPPQGLIGPDERLR
jgi:phosphoglycerate dehydrogenase-like enzyme